MENLGTTAQAKANVSEEKLHVYSGWRQYQEWRIDLVSRSENFYETIKAGEGFGTGERVRGSLDLVFI